MSAFENPGGERGDLLDALQTHRGFLRHTVDGLDDAQAARRTTVSELTLGGLIKHVAHTERGWADFAVEGTGALPDYTAEETVAEHTDSFRMLPGETLAGLLAGYEAVAARTDELVASLDLDARYTIPAAPWAPEHTWSVRRTFTHIIAETAQHAGHADILREALDGQKTMG